ncbi:carbamoyl-phosphate synthase large subunit [Haloferax mediterranei ATCC 33500]|uniref:Carbamoyl phosphate synthase large chain n=1 Tax=Haloferax mediterranei (strain ATCC 33500 / DSM 1411 / JCM 8866 / NBRC 14739 / NCIMB 2177 / R-4) TaxID=523841 RepID=I3R744_HALMT|nr:carbamoyl-phosphate synthase large subunit [Haloferax mediterranei]AFK20054.1 carbamoyl phosphate synthase large subunit [Haloferax mediterranei ATCC 33500]AHZ23431.1 carbamoyl phosphate synthase large subunit [Haloferax mediterranei ATCC 33500]ELZ99602.1 carbamoyl phosphate synthase large subunit [Haloferax mediterranei ATCC 33500]MDX5987194.1 carbamoyl-phosphate synthase large subunit [Haloferax mediterranei ATCC 33500]QCQ76500.1 carbamoyl-phosphate synthase large subunit [Haloferax medit
MTDEDTATGTQPDAEDRTILLIGSGPIQIGQAAEFDYSGAQACRALREEGARVVLVNSNPATIMTDPEMADKVYIEPITTDAISEIIEQERPDGVIAGLGGQTGLNVTAELAEEGVLDEFDVDIMGTPLDTIYATEDRDLFRQRMEKIGQPVPRSTTISLEDDEKVSNITESDLEERVEAAVDEVGGLPVIARTTYTLGGSGSGVVHEMDELVARVRKGLRLSRNSEVLITESISGWVELEYEVMRDADDSCIIICNMENIDPMGIHTGESTVVTPSQVIPDEGHQEMRDAALEVIRELGIQGGCNIQFAWHDDGTPGGEYRVVEVNPRVSRSSALASKATGYPIARVTAKVALGKRLHEITNEITGETTAAFEPAIDYVVTKVPRWPKDKFTDVDFELSTAMKSTGEAMAIGRTFEESLLKALRSSEYEPAADWDEVSDDELESEYLVKPTPDRPYAIFEAFERGYTTEDVVELTGIKEWYVERFGRVVESVAAASEGDFAEAASAGHTNASIAATTGATVDEVEQQVPGRTYKQVDTCAGEFAAQTPYYYSARQPEFLRGPLKGDAAGDELRVDRDIESVVVVGGGPIRIGQGVEFDYCSVHAVQALRDMGIDAHVVNNNPETVSTDYDTSDGLFFEPITAEEVADVVEAIDADGVMLQFGGQTSVNIGHPLESELKRRGLDCEILGTTIDAMDLAEDRDRFNRLMDDLGILQPEGGSATSESEALDLANDLGYPVLVRPSYVLGGRAMEVVYSDAELKEYIEEAVRVSPDKPILIDEFLADGVELDVDAVSDGENVLIGGVMEHVEAAGVHSGDSACMIPPRSLEEETMTRVREVTEDIASALGTVGLMNVQLAVKEKADGSNDVYVLEANPRSSRTVPFVSKATGVPIAKLAAKVMAGNTLSDLDVDEQIPEQVSVKEVVLPFDRLPGSDPRLGPEMKSTGEVMGTATTFGKAYEKAQAAANDPVPEDGTIFVDLADSEFPDADSEAGQELLDGLAEYYDVLTPDDVDDLLTSLREGELEFVVSRDRETLIDCVEEEVSYFSTYASAKAALKARGAADEDIDVHPVSERPRVVADWGK